ncbi:MAG: ATP-binding protein [Paracoccaceae bacterium]
MNSSDSAFHWRNLTLPGQFLLAGAIVMIVAMFVVGNWMARRIEDAVVQNSAASAASFMESFISPLSQELADTDTLSPPARQALAEIFEGTALGERVVSYKIWLSGGRVVHSSDPSLVGQTFVPSDDLKLAWTGVVASSFEDLNDLEDEGEARLGVPLLEVYSPIREAWTGDVIAVAEFYERGDQLAADLSGARRASWLMVSGTFLVSGLLLFGIVQAGGRTIRQQRQSLTEQLERTKKISQQNADLRQRVVGASSRATAQTERAIRRIGSDLHDGPAQYLSLASLRMDAAFSPKNGTPADAKLVRGSIDKALDELRIISRGLALPDLDALDLGELIKRAVLDHTRQTGLDVDLDLPDHPGISLDYAQKLCVFRFLQETLSNATRHARTKKAQVAVRNDAAAISILVKDEGQGFDYNLPRQVRHDGGQGLFGLADRAESIGGQVQITSAPGKGTSVTLTLPIEETPS